MDHSTGQDCLNTAPHHMSAKEIVPFTTSVALEHVSHSAPTLWLSGENVTYSSSSLE